LSYIALYRKYRPQNFDEIVGQKPVVKILKNQLKAGKIGHAYLFCGMRGTGKTSTARVFAKALNCEKGPTDNPCGQCKNCIAFQNGSFTDVVEMDAASHRGIDDIRDLREKVNFPPSQGKYRVYIIDEVHMLTQEAFNALLKTLEEPPKHAVFILCTTEPNRLPATILSRCMRFDFKRVSSTDIIEHLKRITEKQGIKVDDKALKIIARHSQGSIRDALSLLDKAAGISQDFVTYEDVLDVFGAVEDEMFFKIALAVKEKQAGELLKIFEEIIENGKDINRFTEDLIFFYRNLLLMVLKSPVELIDLPQEDLERLKEMALKYKKEEILQILDVLKIAANEVKWTSIPRIVLESALVKLTLVAPTVVVQKESELINKISVLEERIKGLEQEINTLKTKYENLNHKTSDEIEDELKKDEKKDEIPENKSVNEEKGEKIERDKKSRRKTSKEEGEKKTVEKSDEEKDEALEFLKAKWQDVVDFLSKNGKMILSSMLSSFKVLPYKVQGRNLMLLAEGASQGQVDFIMNQKRLIEETVKNLCGIEYNIAEIKIVTEDSKTEGKEEFDDDLIRNVIKLFGEDIVEIKEE